MNGFVVRVYFIKRRLSEIAVRNVFSIWSVSDNDRVFDSALGVMGTVDICPDYSCLVGA